MVTRTTQPVRRTVRHALIMLLALCSLVFALAACGGDSAPAATTSSSSSSSGGSSNASSGGDAGAATAVTITEQTGGNDVYSFSPATVTVKAGQALKFTNNSDENHKLMIDPSGPTAGTVAKSGSNDNTLSVTFPKAGTYKVTSQLVDRPKDGQHNPDPADSKATLTVTVN